MQPLKYCGHQLVEGAAKSWLLINGHVAGLGISGHHGFVVIVPKVETYLNQGSTWRLGFRCKPY
jgi:hypothetical protein